ncbi:MAG: glycosyltransferase family 39 protein, partial [Candidatus Omnitrophica bacterium]|nr:glycosyltransferase family 39 protein [Candidatus Omnitrophota bacterium]
MNKIIEKPFLAITILVLLCAYLFFFKLGGMALTDPDETFYAQTAKEMLARGEWTTPYLLGTPQFEKPILIYWLIEISYIILGVNETAARLPSAVFALLGVIAIYLLGKLLFNKRAGFLAALILAASVEYVVLSRACITDMVLTVFMLLGILFFFYAYLEGKRYFYILSSAAFAFSVLAKGPVAIVLPVAIFLAFAFIAGDPKALRRVPLGWCILAFVIISGPWYYLAYKLHGKEFIDAFFGFQNVTRFMQSEHRIGSQFYYNIPILFGGFFPWSVFLPFASWYGFKKIRSGTKAEKSGIIFLFIWFLAIFIFFSISRTKLPTYIFPSFISLALIVGLLWDDFLSSAGSNRFVALGVKISYYILAAVVAIGAIGVSAYIYFDMPELFKGVVVSSLFLVSGFIASTFAFIKKRYSSAFLLIVASLAIFLLPLGLLVLPEVERLETSKEVALKLRQMMKDPEPLGAQSDYMAGVAFYADKFPVNLDHHEALLKFLNSDERGWCIIKEQNHRGMYDPLINSDYVKPSYCLYKIGKRVIVTNKMPEDGVYLLERKCGKYQNTTYPPCYPCSM